MTDDPAADAGANADPGPDPADNGPPPDFDPTPPPDADVVVEPFALPLSEPLATAAGGMRRRTGFLVRVAAPDGPAGVGEATPLPGWTEPLAACRERLAAAADGGGGVPTVPDGPPVEGGAAGADGADGTDGAAAPRPDAPAARHALVLAAAARQARRAGLPLAARLADRHGWGPPADAVPVNATIGDADPRETAARARSAVADGFDCLKLKVGVGSVARDRDRLRAVRDAVGGDVRLRVDANGGYDPPTARRALDAAASHGVDLIEQPLAPGSPAAHAALRERERDRARAGDRPAGPVAVALDESLAVASPVAAARDLLAAGAADALVCKPMVLGGPDRALAVAAAARAAGATPVVTTTVDAVVARTAAVHVAAAVPDVPACGLATAGLLAADLGPDPAPVSGGSVAVPDGPGLAGGAFDALDAFTRRP